MLTKNLVTDKSSEVMSRVNTIKAWIQQGTLVVLCCPQYFHVSLFFAVVAIMDQ